MTFKCWQSQRVFLVTIIIISESDKFQECNYASTHDIFKFIQETETFIAQGSKDRSNPV